MRINSIKLIPPCPKGMLLYDYLVQEILRRRGNIDNLFFRTVSFHQIDTLLNTGNDRTSSSPVGNKSHEEDIMKDMGLIPGRHNQLFTWVSHFDKSINGLSKDVTIAIYDGAQLELLFQYRTKEGIYYYTNGFAKFKNPLSQSMALIAVYTDKI